MAISKVEFKSGGFEVISPTSGDALRCAECGEKSDYYVTDRPSGEDDRASSKIYCLGCVLRAIRAL